MNGSRQSTTRHLRRAAPLLAALLAGCAHLRPVPLPSEASYEAFRARMLVPADLTARLQDPVVRPAAPPAEHSDAEVQVFSLTEAVAFALENNPRLRLLREAIGRAEGEEQVAFAPFLPEIGFNYRFVAFGNEVQPTSPNVPAVVGFGAGTQEFSQGELYLQWTLWDFGRTAGRFGQAVTRTEIAALRLERARQTVAYDATAAYLRVLLAEAFRLVQEQSVRRAEAILKDTRARRAGGVADRDDVLRAEVQLSETREALVSARQAELEALARLNLTMGRNVSRPLRVVDLQGRPEFRLDLTECLRVAVEQRREIEVARKAMAEAAYGREAAQADFRPRVYVRGILARVDGQGVLNENVIGAGIHFDQQLYVGGKRTGQRQAAEADVRAAAARAQLVGDNIALEVNLAYRAIAVARQRIELAETSVTQARENLRLVRVKYRNGDATPTDIVDAETTLTRSQQRFYTARYDYLTALARLDYAMGRGPGGLLQPPAPRDEAFPDELPVPRPLPPVD